VVDADGGAETVERKGSREEEFEVKTAAVIDQSQCTYIEYKIPSGLTAIPS
jgi:hypothetical protein